jgi:hypothetical protein
MLLLKQDDIKMHALNKKSTPPFFFIYRGLVKNELVTTNI